MTICEPMSWGPVAQVTPVALTTDVTPITGYDITTPQNRFLQEMFKGTNRTSAPTTILLYRPTASGLRSSHGNNRRADGHRSLSRIPAAMTFPLYHGADGTRKHIYRFHRCGWRNCRPADRSPDFGAGGQ